MHNNKGAFARSGDCRIEIIKKGEKVTTDASGTNVAILGAVVLGMDDLIEGLSRSKEEYQFIKLLTLGAFEKIADVTVENWDEKHKDPEDAGNDFRRN